MTEKSLRIDKVAFQTDKAQVTSQGYLLADAYATRVGVFNYLMGDGSLRRELRPPEEVFHPDSIGSLAMVPLTDDHPPVELTADNTQNYMVGYTGQDVRQEGDYLALKISITKKDVAEGVLGKRKDQLSCGYFCDVVPESGVWNGQTYDAIQRNIRYNHLAIVKEGRAGPMARVRMDATSAIAIDENEKKDDLSKIGSSHVFDESLSCEKKGVLHMAKLTIDGVEYEIAEGVAAVVSSKLKKIDELELALKQEKTDKDSLSGRCDGLESENKSLKADLEKKSDSALSRKDIVAIAKARLALEEMAKKACVDEAKLDAMDDIEIKKAIIAASLPSVSLEGKSDAYVDGVFDTIKVDSLKADANNIGELALKSDGVVNLDSMRNKMIEDAKNQWKKSLQS